MDNLSVVGKGSRAGLALDFVALVVLAFVELVLDWVSWSSAWDLVRFREDGGELQ